MQYNSELRHIYFLTDAEQPDERIAGVQPRNRLIGELGKAIIRVYEVRHGHLHQLPTGDVNKYFVQNSAEFPARFTRDRNNRWYILTCDFDPLGSIKDKCIQIKGCCLSNRREKGAVDDDKDKKFKSEEEEEEPFGGECSVGPVLVAATAAAAAAAASDE